MELNFHRNKIENNLCTQERCITFEVIYVDYILTSEV